MASASCGALSSSLTSSTPLQFSSLLEANTYRVKAIVERLTFIMNSKSGAIRFDSSEFFNLCIALARGVDYALTINDVPGVAHRLPSLVKQVYQRRNESYLQPALMVLMISVKNACKNGWFIAADVDELLKMTNEFFSIFCMTVSVTPIVSNALNVISKLVSRFYPQFKLCSLLDSFEAKPGYEILMSDFQIPRSISPEEKIMLIVVRTDNLESSSCIISPPQVSFLVNGKGVDKRTNVSLESGPQFPTDITRMLKFGLNIVQAVGYFAGTYLIAVAFMSKIALSSSPMLKDYIQPVASGVGADSDIIEGASRITLNCPISFRRIKTPVKGHLCKHHQCFDYDNYMEMNSRKPSWRCPFCNQSVSFIDLRIDQNMVKVLNDVGEDVIDIIISADGSWKVVGDNDGTKDRQHKENLSEPHGCNMESMSGRTVTEAVDLTMGEDGKSGSAMSPHEVGPPNNSVSQSESRAIEMEDRKPFTGSSDFSSQPHLAEGPLTNHAAMAVPLGSRPGTVMRPGSWSSLSASDASLILPSQAAAAAGTTELVWPAVPADPIITDAVSPSPIPEPLSSIEASQPNFSGQQISQADTVTEIMQLQSCFANTMIGHEPDRLPIPRHVTRTPIAVQALPVQTQPTSPFKRMRINGPNSSSFDANDLSSGTYEMVHPVTTTSDGLAAPSGETNMQHVLDASASSMGQDRVHQTHQQIRNPALQHVVSLPAPNLLSTRVPSSLQRGAGAYRSSLPSSSSTQTSLASLSNTRHPQASLIMSGASRSSTALPLGATRELARQVAQQKVQAQAGSASPLASRIPAATVLSPRSSMEAPSPSLADLQRDKNWRPTGRMRGSLTGNAYSAALSQYATPAIPMPPANPARAPVPSVVPSTSNQLPSISNNANAQGPVAEHDTLRHNDSGSQPEGSNI